MNEIIFKEYSIFEMPVFWILLPSFIFSGILVLRVSASEVLDSASFKQAGFKNKCNFVLSGVLLFGLLIFLPGIISALIAQGATQSSAQNALQKSIKETYDISITDKQIRTLAPSYMIMDNLPENEFASWGPVTIKHNGQVIEVTVVNMNGQLQLVSGKDTLTELPKRQK